MSFGEAIRGSVVMAPMTKGSNLPYRRLCVELGARVVVSEMVVARRLKQRRRGEFALIRRAPGEPCFGVQLAGNRPDELAWAAALVESRGADFVDFNLGCPIDHFTRKGLGAALARQPARVARLVEAMRKAVSVPVTVKIRLGWNAEHRNYLQLAHAIVDGGASALTVHGRTREARYRHPADWSAIGEVADAVMIPVVGNGDLLFSHEIQDRLATSGCAAVMTARGALIKPWIFREAATGYWDISAEERLDIYRRYVAFGVEHWGPPASRSAADAGSPLDAHGLQRLRDFLRWHVGFWVRYAPRRSNGSWPTMQGREPAFAPRSALEALLARTDDQALDYITDQLIEGGDLSDPPPPRTTTDDLVVIEAG
jgi:tRNA-dihydrouridine synthase 3